MIKTVLVSLFLLGSLTAFADESSTLSLPQSSVDGANGNSVPNADAVDDVLTNANLRAYSGSKSRWSISNSINYNGGTLSEPLAEARPNIGTASGVSTDTDINDQISIKYSLDPFNAFLFGIGVRKMAPFTGHGPSSAFYAEGGKDVDIYDPVLTYQRVYKVLGVQAVAQFQVTQFTRDDIHSPKFGNLDKIFLFDQESMYEIGRFSLGGSTGASGTTPTDSSVDYSRYQFWINPYLEYRITDHYHFRTVANTWNYEYYNDEKKFVMDAYTQSVGVGCSIARDVYLFPNLMFVPGHIAANFTNVGMTATINLF